MDTTPFPDTAGEPQLLISNEAKYYLQSAGKWTTFLGIVGFIMTALVVIFAFSIGSIFAFMAQVNPMMAMVSTGMATMFAGFYLVIALFSFFFALYLFQFGSKIKRAILFNDSVLASAAFSKLKSFFKLWGVTTIVMLCLYALGIAIWIVSFAAVLSAASHN